MSVVALKPPRQLTKLELVDIHLLVMATRPVLRPAPKKKSDASKA